MATRRWSLRNKIAFINPREFVFSINLMDINARNVEHIKQEGLFGPPLSTELPNGYFQDRREKAYDSALIAISFTVINSL
jgi:hypothetical protein